MKNDKKILWYAAAAALFVASGVGYGVSVAPDAVYEEYTPIAFQSDAGAIRTEDTAEADAESTAAGSQSGASGTQPDIIGGQIAEPVDINTATAEELQTLPGIGSSKAAAVIAYREEHGAFTAIEDIMQVPGIKEGTFAKICDRITVGASADEQDQ